MLIYACKPLCGLQVLGNVVVGLQVSFHVSCVTEDA